MCVFLGVNLLDVAKATFTESCINNNNKKEVLITESVYLISKLSTFFGIQFTYFKNASEFVAEHRTSYKQSFSKFSKYRRIFPDVVISFCFIRICTYQETELNPARYH